MALWREARPDYAAALFDRPEPTFRKKEYAEYKAQRPAAPSELISQIIAEGLVNQVEIVVGNDASSDNTALYLNQLETKHSFVKVLNHSLTSTLSLFDFQFPKIYFFLLFINNRF